MNESVRSAIAMSGGRGQGGAAGVGEAAARVSVKVPGGKLVTAVVRFASSDAHVCNGAACGDAVVVSRIAEVRFSGDFFVEKDAGDDAREVTARLSHDAMTGIRSKSVHDLDSGAEAGVGSGAVDGVASDAPTSAAPGSDAAPGDELGFDVLTAMGRAVVGMPADTAVGALARLIGAAIPKGTRLEGASPDDFAAAVVKAVGAVGVAHDDGDDAAVGAAAESGAHTPAMDEGCSHDAPQAIVPSASLLLTCDRRESRGGNEGGEGSFGLLSLAQDDGVKAVLAQDDGAEAGLVARGDGIGPVIARDDEGMPDSARDAAARASRKRVSFVRDHAVPTAWPDERWRKLPLEVVVPGAIGRDAGNAKVPGAAWGATGGENAGSPTLSDNGTNHRGTTAGSRSGTHPSAKGSTPIGDPGAYDPAMQMALDEVLARAVAAGECGPMLRFWEWSAPAVVIGAFQSLHDEVDLAAAQARGMTVVRRMTGGGAMFIEPGNTITYSLYVPASFTEGLTVTQSYRLCDAWLFAALARFGVDAHPGGMNDIVSPAGKIAGAAQRRFAAPSSLTSSAAPTPTSQTRPVGGAILHHVTMAYDIDAQAMVRVLRINKAKTADKAVKSAAKRVDPLRSQTGLSRAAIITHLANTLLTGLPHAHHAAIPMHAIEQARALATAKYMSSAWTACIP